MANGVNTGQLLIPFNGNQYASNRWYNQGSPVTNPATAAAAQIPSKQAMQSAMSNAMPDLPIDSVLNGMPGTTLGMGDMRNLSLPGFGGSKTGASVDSMIRDSIDKVIPIKDMPLPEQFGDAPLQQEEETFYVTITSQINASRTVRLNAMPVINESRTVNYQQLTPVHLPGNYQVYDNTASRIFSLSDVKLISRNSTEATQNLAILKMLRSWTMPFFGIDSDKEVRDYFGAPPEPLYLSAYATDKNRGHLYKIAVVLQSLDITYPNDCDYIKTNDGTPMPIIMPISSLVFAESHSAYEYEQFNLVAYRQGMLTYF